MDQSYFDRLIASAEKRAQQGCTRSMCFLHLLDLKRAGHSPKRTELQIPEGHTPARFDMPIEYVSGSVAGSIVSGTSFAIGLTKR